MEELGWAGMRIVPTFEGFGSRLRTGTRSASSSVAASEGGRFGSTFGARASSAMRTKLSESAKYIIGPLLGAFAVEKIGELIGESIHAASDLEAAQARANLIFGEGADAADRFGEHSAKSLGLSHLAALRAETGFGLLGQRMELNDQQNVKFSENFVGLAADLAAFNHTDPESAFLALQRGVAGATRGLKPYGVLIDSTSIKAEALADGILKPVKDQAAIHSSQVRVLEDQKAYTVAIAEHGKASIEAQRASANLESAQEGLNKVTEGAVPALTQQQKMLASAKLIMEQTTTQQGAFKRSSHDLYGEQRKLSASFDNAKDRLGKGLLPVATDFVHAINKNVIPAVDDASYWFEKKGGPAIHSFQHELGPLVHESMPLLATTFESITGTAKTLLPLATGIFHSFNALPDFAKKAIVVGGGAALIGRKFGLLGGARGGAAAEIATLARPLPVFVTNPGFGGGVGGKGAPIVTAADAAAAEEAAAGAAGKTGFFARFFGKGALGRLAGTALSAPALITLGDSGAEQGAAPKIDNSHNIANLPGPPTDVLADFHGNLSALSTWAQLDKDLTHLLASGNLDKVESMMRDQATAGAALEGISLDEAYRQLDDVLPRTTAKLDRWTKGTNTGERAIRTFGMGFNSTIDGVTSRTAEFNSDLSKLPKQVQTKISTPGMDLSRSAAVALARQYNLTPKQVDTLFRVLGIDEARRQITGLLGIYRAGIPSTGGRTVSDPSSIKGGSGGGGGSGMPKLHVHLHNIKVDQDGRVSASVGAELEEQGRFYRQRVEAGSRG